MLRRLPLLLAAAAVLGVLLVACGGGSKALPPSSLSADKAVAAWGETVTLQGADLGHSGSLGIGGVDVPPTSWAQDRVVLTVPSSAPAGPQKLTLTTEAGQQSIDLFVGVDYPAGSLDALATLALPKGTAVRLGAGTFSASSEVFLDNLSLYGRGEDSTMLSTGSVPLQLLADAGYDLTMADLTLRTDLTQVRASKPLLPVALSEEQATGPRSLAEAFAQVQELVKAMGEGDLALHAQAVQPHSYTLRSVTIEPASAAAIGLLMVDIIDGAAPSFYGGDLLVKDVTAADSQLAFLVLGSVEVQRLHQESGSMFMAASVYSRATVNDSRVKVEVDPAAALGSGIMIAGARGVTLTDSVITSDGADLLILGTSLAGALPLGGPSVIRGNTLVATDIDPLDGEEDGNVAFLVYTSTGLVDDNDISADGDVIFELLEAATTVRNNRISVGSPDYLESYLLLDQMGGQARLVDNDVLFLSDGGLSVIVADQVRLQITGNDLTGHDDAGTALMINNFGGNDGNVEASGNRFTAFGEALHFRTNQPSSEFTARINDNVFDFVIDAPAKAATVVDFSIEDAAVLDATNNVWGTNTLAADVASYVLYPGSVPGILKVDPIKQP